MNKANVKMEGGRRKEGRESGYVENKNNDYIYFEGWGRVISISFT